MSITDETLFLAIHTLGFAMLGAVLAVATWGAK
jgi:hypothetical protein